MFAFAFLRCGRREDAEDVTAETFAAAVSSIHAFCGDARIETWLIGIARRKLIDVARRRGRRPEVLEADLGDADPLAAVAPSENPQDAWERRERTDRVRALVLQLPELQSTVAPYPSSSAAGQVFPKPAPPPALMPFPDTPKPRTREPARPSSPHVQMSMPQGISEARPSNRASAARSLARTAMKIAPALHGGTGALEVQIWIAAMPDHGVRELEKLGFRLAAELRPGQLLLGRLPAENLKSVAALTWVVLIEPPSYK